MQPSAFASSLQQIHLPWPRIQQGLSPSSLTCSDIESLSLTTVTERNVSPLLLHWRSASAAAVPPPVPPTIPTPVPVSAAVSVTTAVPVPPIVAAGASAPEQDSQLLYVVVLKHTMGVVGGSIGEQISSRAYLSLERERSRREDFLLSPSLSSPS